MPALSAGETLYVLLGVFACGVVLGAWFGVRFGRWLERHDLGGR